MGFAMRAIIIFLFLMWLVGCSKTIVNNVELKYHLGDIVEVTSTDDFYYGCYGVVTGTHPDQVNFDQPSDTFTYTPRYQVDDLSCPKLKNIKGMNEKSIKSLISTQTTLSLKK